MRTSHQEVARLAPGMGAKDWLLSAAFHALLLASAGWGLSNSTLPASRHTPLDMTISWVAEPVALPVPLPPPSPVARVNKLAPKVAVPARVPAPVAPARTVQPSPVSAPDVVLTQAPVSAPVLPIATAQAEALPSAKTAPIVEAAPIAGKLDEQPRWHSQLEAMLLKHKQYPMVGRRMRQEGVVTVEAHFSARGDILHCMVAKSSGFKALDESAMQLVRQAAASVRASHQPGRAVELRIPIVYELKES